MIRPAAHSHASRRLKGALKRIAGLVAFFGPILTLGAAQNTPLSADEAARGVNLPPGFHVSLYAAEPAVRQPIALSFDDRGRLWIAECLTYSNAATNFDLTAHDQVLIFEGSNTNGQFRKRTVFWDKGQRLTSIAPGFGGMYVLCAPNLLFIPDRNQDDIPDGPPEVLLDGWNADAVRHNIVNGLKWGPDGWLYGRHGILATSAVGAPGTLQKDRVRLNCCIWRYHPVTRKFEVVCQGTTNPWGHDWDESGRLFFINTVIGHVWEGVPGAWYKRMYGEHLARFRYGLIDQAADHYHWAAGQPWQVSREESSGAGAYGGGHAHSGLMIYQGTNWPAKYRGQLFTLNFHGRRINEDSFAPRDSGPVLEHQKDFAFFNDPWFRGIDLDYGPDGAAYALDWSDTGECHGTESVNTQSGRIYRIWYGETGVQTSPLMLDTSGNEALLKWQLQPNEWYVRHARRLLQERSAAGELQPEFVRRVKAAFRTETNALHRLRLFLLLHCIGVNDETTLLKTMDDADANLRTWAVRFAAEEFGTSEATQAKLVDLARRETSAQVRRELASAAQRLTPEHRLPLIENLCEHSEDNADRYIPFLLWYGTVPISGRQPTNALNLAAKSKIPVLQNYAARRLTEMAVTNSEPLALLFGLCQEKPVSFLTNALAGMIDGLRSLNRIQQPATWKTLRDTLSQSQNFEVMSLAQEVGVLLGDPWASASLTETAKDSKQPFTARRAALDRLIAAHSDGLEPLLRILLADSDMASGAARGLINFKAADLPALVVGHWQNYPTNDQPALLNLFVTRLSFAREFVEAVSRHEIVVPTLTAFQAVKLRSFNDAALNAQLSKIWGIQELGADKKQKLQHYREILSPSRLAGANASKGRVIFNQSCALCHKLYGMGASIGPDLTGGGRADREYLLENILDPNAVVPADYQTVDIELTDGRSLTGLVISRNEQSLVLQTPVEKFTLPRSSIVKLHQTQNSLMPEGLLESLPDDQVANLIAYLMSSVQVPLPAN